MKSEMAYTEIAVSTLLKEATRGDLIECGYLSTFEI